MRVMQWILGIDFSANPCELTLSKVEGSVVEIVNYKTIDLPLLNDRTLLSKTDITPLIMTPRKKKGEVSDEEDATDIEKHPEVLEPTGQLVNSSIANLRETIVSLEHQWTAVSVIIPPHDHLALNLNLPFGDAKNLKRKT